MQVNFSKTGEGNQPAPEITKKATETPVAEVVVESVNSSVPALATSPNTFQFGDDLPGFREVKFPRINIVHNVGNLKDTFTPGEIVFGQTTVVFRPPIKDAAATPAVNFTVAGIVSKRFSEKVIGGIGGEICDTEAEVRTAGGTTDYNEWKLKEKSGMKRFEPLNDMLIVIKRPAHVADDDTVFSFVIDGEKYALGLWSVKGTAYTAAYKEVLALHRLQGVLRGGYPMHNFSLSTRTKKFPTGLTWVPLVVPATKSSPAMIEFIKAIVNPQ